MSRAIDVVHLSGDEYDRLMDEREILRKECERAWGEVDAASASLKKCQNDLMEALNALGQIVTMADRAIGCSPSEQDDYLVMISESARKVALR
jgi:hypothetical protein